MAEINETLVGEVLDNKLDLICKQVLLSPNKFIITIEDFENIKNLLNNSIDKVASLVPSTISTKDENILAKKVRAEINTKIKNIDRFRIDSIKDFTADFTTQCNALTSKVKEVELLIAQKIKAFEDSQKVGTLPKPKTTKVTLKFFENEKTLKKLETFCLDNNIEMKVEVK